jgi:hypothetical protein
VNRNEDPMSTTARLQLPYIAPQQAQKQVTYNAAMALLDQLVQPAVKSRTTVAPPGGPAEGDTYIVAPSATGAWAGKDGRFAAWLSGGWSFVAPAEGWLAYVVDTAELAVYASGAWASFVTMGGTALARLGINATADLTTRLAVAADASRFTHAGSSHRMALDKATAADTASLSWQDNGSGRAELGLTGDDALHLKVSPDGSSWIEAFTVAQASGLVSLPAGQLAFPATQNPSANANTLDDYEEGSWTPVLQFSGASTGVTYGATTLGRYTRIGNLVAVSGVLTLTSKGTSVGAAQIVGLPFVSLNDGIYNAVAVGYATSFASVTGAVIGLVLPNASKIGLYQSNNGAAAALTQGNFGNTSAIYFSASYQAV